MYKTTTMRQRFLVVQMVALMAMLPLSQMQAFDLQIDWRKDDFRQPVNSVAFSENGRLIGSAGHDKWLRLYHAHDGVNYRSLHLKEILGMIEAPQEFAPYVTDEPSPGAPAMRSHPFTYGFHDLSFAKGLPLVASAFTVKFKDDYDNIANTAGYVLIWNYETDARRLVRIFSEAGGSKCTPLRAVKFSPDGRTLACAGDNGKLTLVDAQSGRHFYSVNTPATSVSAMAFSDNGRLLAAGGKGKLTVYKARTGEMLQQFDNGKQRPHVLAFAPGSRELYSGGYDSKLRVFDVANGTEEAIMTEFKSCVRGAVFSRGGQYLIAAALDQKLRLYRTKDHSEMDVFAAIKERHNALAISPDGRYLALGTMNGSVMKLDLPFRMQTQNVNLANAGSDAVPAQRDAASKQHMLVGPNPADQATSVEWTLNSDARVKLEIHNTFGDVVALLANEQLPAGEHLRRWQIGEMPSGVYYVRLNVNGVTTVRKLVVSQ